MAAGIEYTIDELARTADTTVRSVRVYHERGLLPPPQVRGRIGYYRHEHLSRLRTISRLLGQGVTLHGIGELLAAWDRGEGLADVLGVADQWMPHGQGTESEPDDTTLQMVERIGSPRARDLAVRLLQGGMSLHDTFDTLDRLRADCERVAIDNAVMFEVLSVGDNERSGHCAAQAISELVAELLRDAASPRKVP